MKKLFFVLVLLTLANELFQFLGPRQAAFRAYESQAGPQQLESIHDLIDGRLLDIRYHLISVESVSEDELRLVVNRAVQFDDSGHLIAIGGRKIAKTRQHVLMRRVNDEWKISVVEEDATEVTELSEEILEQ